jgi:hypothetical protein
MDVRRYAVHHPKTFHYLLSSLLASEGEGTSPAFADPAALAGPWHPSRACAPRECGEVALMRAVLADAIKCFQRRFLSTRRRDQRLATEAEEWLFTDNSSRPFSFVHICAVLGVEPGYLRLGLKRCGQQIRTHPQRACRPPASRRQPLRLAA